MAPDTFLDRTTAIEDAAIEAFNAGRDDALDGRRSDPTLESPELTSEYRQGYRVGLADLATLSGSAGA